MCLNKQTINSCKTILIVDDDEAFRISLQKILVKSGYNAVTAKNVPDALLVIQRKDIDLLIVDYCMPRYSGVLLLKQLKQTHPQIHSIVMSAYGDDAMRKECITAGALLFLDKPVKRTELLDTIQNIFAPAKN